jgi:hypothetical protein
LATKVRLEDKKLYHQIHPLKMFTDFASGFLAVYLLWIDLPLWALIVAFVPSLAISLYVLTQTNLDRYKNSALGRYTQKYLSAKSNDTIRFIGFVAMMFGGWYHSVGLIVAGFLVILGVWFRGFILPEMWNRS